MSFGDRVQRYGKSCRNWTAETDDFADLFKTDSGLTKDELDFYFYETCF